MALDFPSSPSVGTQYVAPIGVLYLYDNGGSWVTINNNIVPSPYSDAFRYRTIYTRGYMLGGYASSTPWKNVNKTQHSTDMTTNLGDILDKGCSYVDGGYSDYNAYVYGTDDAWDGASTYTCSMSMATDANRTHNTNWDTKTSRSDVGCMINSTNTIGYITAGGSTATDKHNYVTDTMYASGSVGASSVTGTSYGNAAEWHGATKGWVQAATCSQFTFSTEVYATVTATVGTDGWGKALSTKHGHAYVKNGSNTVAGAYKLNDTTNAQIRTDLTFENAGEENYEMGQNWGYCIGLYNGAQVNNTYKVNYLTDVYTSLGSDTQPKGHAGASSGSTAPASAYVLGGI